MIEDGMVESHALKSSRRGEGAKGADVAARGTSRHFLDTLEPFSLSSQTKPTRRGSVPTPWREPMSAPFTFVEIFSDPTPRAIVNKRLVTPLFFLAQQTTDLSDDEHKRLFRLLVLCGKKLVATWRHLQRFEEIQARTVEKVRLQLSPGPNDAVQIATAQDLFLEFDEFLVQLKSTLDYLVKIPHVLLGNCWNLRTFGDKGGDVVKALQNNVPKKYENQSRGIEKRVMDQHGSWLGDAS